MSWRDQQLEEGVLRDRAFLGRGEVQHGNGEPRWNVGGDLVDLVPICEQRRPWLGP